MILRCRPVGCTQLGTGNSQPVGATGIGRPFSDKGEPQLVRRATRGSESRATRGSERSNRYGIR